MSRIIIDYIWIYNNKLMFKTNIVKLDTRRYPDIPTYIGDTPRILKDEDLEKIFPTQFYDNDKILNLIPYKIYNSPFSENRYILLCEVFVDNNTPHKSNKRFLLKNNKSCKKIKIKQNISFSDNNTNIPSYKISDISNINIIDEYVEICLNINIKLTEIYTLDENSWCCEFNNNNIITNIDDLVVSMYILSVLSKKNKTFINFNDTYIVIDNNGINMKLYDMNLYDIINLI